MNAPVTVVVPVYGGLEDVRRCLDSVVRHAGGDHGFELLVIDDCSPDPQLRQLVADFAPDPSLVTCTVVRNEENLGFVKTCGRAMRDTRGDVVLLNADTVVTQGWLDHLIEVGAEPNVATVTPLTNFGSICTLPAAVIAAFDLEGPEPRIDECGSFVSEWSIGRRPEVITGVGFCMYVTRAALDACGSFDEDTFGAGYGEEVDFCLRASGHGFRHLVDDNTFVYHRGGVSFSDRRAEGLRRSSEIIHRRYPYFRAMNQRERADDPLAVSFAALELGLAPRRSDRSHVLQVLHSKPGELGGTEKHFWRLVEGLLKESDITVFQPCDGGFLLSTVWLGPTSEPVRHEFLIPGESGRGGSGGEIDDPGAKAALETVLDMFEFDAVHIQNIVHHSLAPLAVLADFPGPVSCSVRDLFLACPHHWLLYRNERACGIPEDLSLCARCLPMTRNLELDFLEEFRSTVADRLDTIDHWVFASQSAVDFFLRAYEPDPARVTVIEHGAIIDHDRAGRAVDLDRILDEPLRVGFVGIGWAKKGLPAVNELAEGLARSTIEIHHFGELREPISPLIHEHGRYDNEVLPELLRRAGIQVVLLPGAFVETFGHVMTESLIAGLPIIGNRHGALGQRIRTHEVGWTIDPEDVGAMQELIENLDQNRLELLRATRRAVTVDLRSVEDTVPLYASLYRSQADDRSQSDRGSVRVAPTGSEPMAGLVQPDPDGVDHQALREAEKARLQRELRAMGTVNRRLQVQLVEANQRAKTAANKKPKQGKTAPTASGAGAPQASGAGSIGQTARSRAGRVKRAVRKRGWRNAGREAVRRSSDMLRRR